LFLVFLHRDLIDICQFCRF